MAALLRNVNRFSSRASVPSNKTGVIYFENKLFAPLLAERNTHLVYYPCMPARQAGLSKMLINISNCIVHTSIPYILADFAQNSFGMLLDHKSYSYTPAAIITKIIPEHWLGFRFFRSFPDSLNSNLVSLYSSSFPMYKKKVLAFDDHGPTRN